MTESNSPLPGRLGNANATLADDGRADPRLRAISELLELRPPDIAPISADSTYEECLAYCSTLEEAAAAKHPELLVNLPVFDSVATSTQVIDGIGRQ